MSNLFEDGKTTPPAVDPEKNYLEDLVGEGKKFADASALAKGKAEADAHIAKLEAEQEGLRKDLTTRLSLEDFLAEIKEQKPSVKPDEGSQPPAGEGADSGTVVTQAMSPEEVAALVQQQIATTQQTTQKESNLALVATELAKAWGPNYSAHLAKKAQEIGVSQDFLTSMAEGQPTAFLKLVVDPKSPVPSATPPHSSTVNPGGPGSTGLGKSHFDKLRKADPREYWKASTQRQLHDMAASMGLEKFNAS